MDQKTQEQFLEILNTELVPALGCTEPIALAYAAAKVRDVLGQFPERMELYCSGNIIKNVKSVTIPNSGGLVGIEMAVILGAVGGNAEEDLKVLESVTPAHIEKAQALAKTDFLCCKLQEGVANLYIDILAHAGDHSAQVTIVNRHTLITKILRDGEVLYRNDPIEKKEALDLAGMDVFSILNFANTVDLDRVRPLLDRQITANERISQEGLNNPYGAQVGRTLLECYGQDIKVRARARAAAGSDARMNGCSLPVVINSGSGNQGLTVSLPVVEYAREWGKSLEELYRALLISNLVSIYQKHYIGSLSAFCGAVTAACGAGAGITYLAGGDYQAICRTIVNTIGNVGGIICDGAKSSCAAKIASALDAAILGYELSMKGRVFKPGEGIIQEDIEETIRSTGYVGRVGMKTTDVEILNLMLHQCH